MLLSAESSLKPTLVVFDAANDDGTDVHLKSFKDRSGP